MKITFRLECGVSNNNGPDIEIQYNGVCLIDTSILIDTDFSIDIDNSVDSLVLIVHKNKTDHDTVIKDGSIVADKYIKISKIWVDDILLSELLCYTTCNPIYSQSFLESVTQVPPAVMQSNNLYFNGTLTYTFKKNFFNWYCSYKKDLDMRYLTGHSDSEAEQKFLGYDQTSAAEGEIIKILEAHGYRIIN